MEKAAFIQSLRIIPAELNALKQQLSQQMRGTGGTQASLSAALAAIGTLIGDTSSSSTLNNAALFTKIDAATLTQIANKLIDYRQTISDAVNKSVANILSTYRGSLTLPATATAKTASYDEGGEGNDDPVEHNQNRHPDCDNRQLRRLRRRFAPRRNIEAHAFSVHVALDEAQPTPAAFSPVLTADQAAYTPSNAEAL